MKKIKIEIPDGKKAEWVNGVLTLVDDKPKAITDRIKTLEDACEWCKENGRTFLVLQYEMLDGKLYHFTEDAKCDILAYLKLRIITAALNEGWEPTFDTINDPDFGDEVFAPFLPLLGKKGYIGGYKFHGVPMFELTKRLEPKPVLLSGIMAKTLFFKNSSLAYYAAKQFRDIYADFCGCEKGGEK